jgi:hypothetical protein
MTGSGPISSTGKRHPVFARVFARVGPAMDAQGALEHRRALLAGLAGRVLEVGAGSGLNFAHYPPAATELLAVEPELDLRALAETAAQQAAVPIRVVDGTAVPCPVLMPAWTPPSHRWCCARCPTKPAPWRNCAGCYAPVASFASSSTSKRHLRPGQGPAPRRRHLAHLCWRLPHQPRHADRHHHCRLPSRQHPPVPVSRQPAAVASRAARARDRSPPTRIPTGGAPSDRLNASWEWLRGLVVEVHGQVS